MESNKKAYDSPPTYYNFDFSVVKRKVPKGVNYNYMVGREEPIWVFGVYI